MAQLVCEVCGSNDLVKQEDMFICQVCGAKYSVEAVKKLMVQGPAGGNNNQAIDNYFEMAKRAYDANNLSETENYCNKVTEIDPNHYQALALKGKAAGWQSSLGNIRFAEAVNYYLLAIENAPEEERQALVSELQEQEEGWSPALMRLQGNRFSKWPDDEEAAGILKVLTEVYKQITQTIRGIGGRAYDAVKIRSSVANVIEESVMSAWRSTIVPNYRNDNSGHPSDYAFRKLIDQGDYCIDLLKQAIEVSEEDEDNNISRYQDMITIQQYLNSSCSYDYQTVMTGYDRWDGSPMYENQYVQNLSLNDSAKASRRSLISSYESSIRQIKATKERREAAKRAEKERKRREEAQKRYDAYWADHKEERAALENEQKELGEQARNLAAAHNNRLAALNKEMEEASNKIAVTQATTKVNNLVTEKNALGIFKGKEKKALQEQIDQAEAEKKELLARIDQAKKAVESKIASEHAQYANQYGPLKTRMDQINNELTRAR